MNEQTEIIDLSYLRQHTKSNPALMSEMIGIYLEQTPLLINAMKEGLTNMDWHLLHAAAHKLKPSFRIIGMPSNNETITKNIQELAATGQSPGIIADLIGTLEKACTTGYIELNKELNTLRELQSVKTGG